MCGLPLGLGRAAAAEQSDAPPWVRSAGPLRAREAAGLCGERVGRRRAWSEGCAACGAKGPSERFLARRGPRPSPVLCSGVGGVPDPSGGLLVLPSARPRN